MKKAIIVDDEQPAIDRLDKMLKAEGVTETAATFTDPMGAIAYLRENKTDVVFLDIEMPGINGIELADSILEINRETHIIFVTAYHEYAVEAFKLHALDYLLKPVEKSRLCMALERIPDKKPRQHVGQDIKAYCFGKFKVTVNGEEIKFRTAKAEEMLALLIDQNGSAIHRNTVMDLFWADSDGDCATILFNTTLHYLKKAFIQQGRPLQITYDRGTYCLNMQGIFCDGNYFLSEMENPEPITKENLQKYEALADIYSGNYLEQNDYIWAEQKRLLLKEKYARLILSVAKFHRENGSPQKAVDILHKGLCHDPLNKDINYCLFELFIHNKDRVKLIEYYETYKTALYNEFGMEPDEECRKLVLGRP